MKVNVEFELEESAVVKAITKKIAPQANVDKDAKISCIYGSVSQTVHDDGTIGVQYEIDRRIIPGLYGVLEKHETAVQGIVMMVGGLVQTVKVAVKNIADDTKKFFEDFKVQKNAEDIRKDSATVEEVTDVRNTAFHNDVA